MAAGDAAVIAVAAAADDDDADGEMRGFFGEIFFAAGCKRLRSFRKSAKTKFEWKRQKGDEKNRNRKKTN